MKYNYTIKKTLKENLCIPFHLSYAGFQLQSERKKKLLLTAQLTTFPCSSLLLTSVCMV